MDTKNSDKLSFRELYQLLDRQVNPGIWWPATTRFEIAVGAILTQNTAWTNVEIALSNLRDAEFLTSEKLANISTIELAEYIRPAGFFNAKSVYINAFATWYCMHDARAQRAPLHQLRKELLSLKAIGEETADDILLYMYQHPVFIYDAYARRLLSAYGLEPGNTYRNAKRMLDSQFLAEEFTLLEAQKFHGLIVETGKIARKLGGWERAIHHLREGKFLLQ